MNLKKILASVAAAAMAVSGMTVASFAADTSAWRVVACVYDGSWDGWKFVESEAGVLTLETTVADLKAKHSAAEGNLGGVAVQVWGGEVGEELEYTVTIGTAVNESGTAAFEKGSGDNSATVGQYSTALTGGAYEFADEDAVVVTVTPVGGVDEPATDDEPTEDPAEPEDNTPDVTPDDAAPSEDGEPELPPEIAELADELEELTEMEGLKYMSISGNDKGEFDGYLDTVFAAEIGLEASDVIVVAVVPSSEDTDISNWVVDLKGFDYNWGGWQGVSSDPGVVMLATNVQEILDANGFTMDDLQGFNLEISGIPAGEYEEAYVVAVMLVVSEDAVDNLDAANGETDGAGADPSKGSPDTGAEGVAVVAGIAIVAAGAIVVAKKRK